MLGLACWYERTGFVLALFREFMISVNLWRGYQRTFMVQIVIHLSSFALERIPNTTPILWLPHYCMAEAMITIIPGFYERDSGILSLGWGSSSQSAKSFCWYHHGCELPEMNIGKPKLQKELWNNPKSQYFVSSLSHFLVLTWPHWI